MFLINDYTPMTIPEQLEFRPVIEDGKHVTNLDGEKKFQLFINGEPVKCICQHMDSCTWPPDDYILPESRVQDIKDGFASLTEEFPFKIRNFSYNGFFGRTEEGYAPYRAQFLRWSGDPGVAVMSCSDGEDRFIPTYALEGPHLAIPPDNTAFEDKLMFGYASTS